jgi:endonuclease/exonuclease/phosphatase family metal-dependent hydrolase
MGKLKLATFNIEWMLPLFGARKDADWLAHPAIPRSFPGGSRGSIRFDPIADVPALCRRIAGTIRSVDPDVLIVQEGPPLAQQMALFVKRFLGDDYAVHRSNRNNQAVFALVRRPLADRVEPWLPQGRQASELWRNIPYYGWGRIGTRDRRAHACARFPLLLRCELKPGHNLIVCAVHTKSKFSTLKRLSQWERRDLEPAPVLDALTTRQKISAEVARLRQVLAAVMTSGPEFGNVVVLGDFNDGPFADLMEAEFMIHNILDELVGSFVVPNTYLKHAMDAAALARAATTRFRDPLQGGKLVSELIDHVLLSPGIWSGLGPYRVAAGSCKVEEAAWQAQLGPDPDRRADRPSDHMPVSVEIEWDG